MATRPTRFSELNVTSCPRCRTPHTFTLEILCAPTYIFAGPGDGGEEIALTCPRTGKIFTRRIRLADGEQFSAVVVPDTPDTPDTSFDVDATSQMPSDQHDEFSEWASASRATATTFCSIMLSTAVGSIPAYFAVLKYLGTKHIAGTALEAISVVPPTLFLITMGIFVMALRPRLISVTPDQFPSFRREHFRRLNHFIATGTTLFGVGLALAISVFAVALYAR